MSKLIMRYGYVDFDGNEIKRTPIDYPYSYDPYITYKNGTKEDVNGTVYSDRLFQWDHEKYNKCCREIWGNHGQYFSARTPESIQRFLQAYLGKTDLKLIAIMQGANVSNGYPYWLFMYNSKQQ